MKKDFIYWLRWVAVLPGTLIAGLLSTFPLHWILYFLFNEEETGLGSVKFFIQLFGQGINYKDIEYAIFPFIIAIVFVLVGAEIAPKYKFGTAIVLTVLYIMAVIGVFLLGPKYGVYGSFEARSVGPIIGLLIGLYIVRGKEKNLPQKSKEPNN